jgi:REP element-mobilizing transposase RayT
VEDHVTRRVHRYDPQKHHRRSVRLKGYDYAQPGAYFVTICAQHRECLFGEIRDGEMVLNDAGRMAQAEWERLPQRFRLVTLDVYVVMPNHIHGILVIHTLDAPVGEPPVGATLVVAPSESVVASRAGTSPAPRDTGTDANIRRPALGDIVGAYESITTNAYIRGVGEHRWPPFDRRVWQRNYYERVIRNERELDGIRQYIIDNPLKWELDRYYPPG